MKLNAQVKHDFGGKKRLFVLNLNTMAEIEEVLGVNLMKDGESFFEDLTFVKMRALVWALLHKETPRPTAVEVGEWLSSSDLEEISGIIGSLFSMDSIKDGKKTKQASDPTKG